MPVTFAINNVLDRLGKATVAALTAAGEAPRSLPRATTADQAAFLATDLPVTILETGKLTIDLTNANAASLRLMQRVTLHHIRALVPGGSAVETATARMSAVCAALYQDYRLESVSQAATLSQIADQSIEMVLLTEIMSGADNPVQQLLDMNDQSDSLVCVSVRMELHWVEDGAF